MCDDETINCMAVCLCGIWRAIVVVGTVSIRQEDGIATEWNEWNASFCLAGRQRRLLCASRTLLGAALHLGCLVKQILSCLYLPLIRRSHVRGYVNRY